MSSFIPSVAESDAKSLLRGVEVRVERWVICATFTQNTRLLVL